MNKELEYLIEVQEELDALREKVEEMISVCLQSNLEEDN